MQRTTGVKIASAIAAVAIAAPILICIRLAWDVGLTGEESHALSYSRNALHRSEETAVQFSEAIDRLNHDHLPACSADEIDLMRQIALVSSYIQAVGRVSGNSLICTSLDTKQPIPLGPAELLTEYGVTQRNNIPLSIAGGHPMNVLSKDGIAIVVAPSLLFDTPNEGPDVSVGVFVPSSSTPRYIARHNGEIRPEWLRAIPKGTESSFTDTGYVISVVRSARYDIGVITAVPEPYATMLAKQLALVFVPVGLLCGGGLAWAVLYISRIRLSHSSQLRAAARRGEFFVEYQPVVELATRRLIGAEALVRWRSNGEIVRPDHFIPLAEESGVITIITEQVLAMVTKDLPKLLSRDSGFQVAINLSAADIRSRKTIGLLSRLLETSGAHPSNIEIEATERGFLQGSEASGHLAQIRAMGFDVAIDDFGTGYSSLSCLQTLGLDTLKIDKAFVDTIGTDGATSQVVLHIIEIARSLNLGMVAEGVETEAQAQFLRDRGVHYAQGWLFGKPMAVERLCDLLGAQQANDPANAGVVLIPEAAIYLQALS
jgi:sensor c-di-GMP phosphodiesterase-like protein